MEPSPRSGIRADSERFLCWICDEFYDEGIALFSGVKGSFRVWWRREWDLNPRGPKAHRISTPAWAGLAIRRHTWLGDPGVPWPCALYAVNNCAISGTRIVR